MSEETPIVTEVASLETTIPNTSPVDTPSAPDFNSIIPQEFAEKPWVKDVKDIDGFFKMADDMKSELGRRAETAPAAPDSVDAYELSEPTDKEFQDSVKKMFLDNKVPPEMAKGLDAAWNELMAKRAPDPEAADAEFHKMTGELFGDRADEVMKTAKSLLSEHTPDSMTEQVNGLGNKELTIMAAVLDSIQDKFINEDDLPRGGAVVSGVKSNEEKRAEAKTLMATPEFKSKSHPSHDEVALKVAKLYESLT